MTTSEVAVLIESFQSQFRIFGDELKSIARRLDNLESTVARIWEKVTTIDLRLIRVEKTVAEIHFRLTKVETDVAEIKVDVKGHSQRISHLEAIK